MKHSLFVLCFAAVPFLTSCTFNFQREIKGNYIIVHEKIPIDDYDEIVLNVPADVYYQQISQDRPFLQLSVDRNVLPGVEVSVENHRLTITRKNDSLLTPSRFRIYTNSRNLSKVSVAGSGDFYMEREVNAGSMEIHVSGSGDVKADSLYCEKIRVTLSGAGDAEISGAATDAEFHVSGAGDIRAFDFLANTLDCSVSGAGDIRAFAYERLNISVSGAGDVEYKGNPASVTQHLSGAGNIRKVE
ncbi:MAG: DUF2807 domain-containing protein [Dysgonamonadaceae bacterium]|jgi:hypothetical protein|nr:DUF2807 domain-containing protein [Dysgonamonadaceae bacterium]